MPELRPYRQAQTLSEEKREAGVGVCTPSPPVGAFLHSAGTAPIGKVALP